MLKALETKIQEIKQCMLDYYEIAKDDVEHTKNDINKVIKLIKKYIKAAEKNNGNKEKILAKVEALVLSLNKLNEICGYGLLETDERELICILINNVAKTMGANNDDEDLTEEFREW